MVGTLTMRATMHVGGGRMGDRPLPLNVSVNFQLLYTIVFN